MRALQFGVSRKEDTIKRVVLLKMVVVIVLGQVQELVEETVGLLQGLRAHLLEGVALVLGVHGVGHPNQGLVPLQCHSTAASSKVYELYILLKFRV